MKKFIAYLIIYTVKSLQIPSTVIDNVFRKSTPNEIIDTFKTLKSYSQQKADSNKLYISDQQMFVNFARNLDKGISYTKAMHNKTMYLAWTPLSPFDKKIDIFDQKNIIRRNDCEGIDYKLIPLYFVFITNEKNQIYIDRIYQNPAIELNIDIQILKKHIEQLSEISGIEINYDKLKYFDNGRFFYEFSKNRP